MYNVCVLYMYILPLLLLHLTLLLSLLLLQDQYASPTVSFPITRITDLEQGCSAIFDRSMVPVQRLLDSLGKN